MNKLFKLICFIPIEVLIQEEVLYNHFQGNIQLVLNSNILYMYHLRYILFLFLSYSHANILLNILIFHCYNTLFLLHVSFHLNNFFRNLIFHYYHTLFHIHLFCQTYNSLQILTYHHYHNILFLVHFFLHHNIFLQKLKCQLDQIL